MKNMLTIVISAALGKALASILPFDSIFGAPLNQGRPLDAMRASGFGYYIELALVFAVTYWIVNAIAKAIANRH